ncbi:MFS transporter [Dactylosporangium sp. NPDC051484]|uniref:MFS transporter n=1 Tax=Dactylosporangium sp. NPDC051484 TaxID=3154942 RepID=UPI00344C5997
MSESLTSANTSRPADTPVSDPPAPAGPGVRTVAVLSFATLFVIGTDTFLVAPLLPTLSHAFGVGTNISGWMVSAYALGYASLALFAGPLSDRLDRRRVLLTGLAAFALATALCGVAQSFWMMILFRFLAGVSAAFVTPQIWASIPVLVPPKLIVRTMGTATAGLSIAQVVGIPIGSWLAAASWHTPFWALGGASVLLWTALARFFPSVPPHGAARRSIRQAYGDVLRTRTLVLYLLAYLVFQTGNFEAFSFIGSWFTRDFHLDVASVGTAMIALGAGNTIGSLFGSRLIGRIGQQRSLLLSFVALLALYAALPFAPDLAVAVTLLTVIFLIGGFVFPIFMAMLQSQTTTARGTVSSLSNAAMYVGSTIGGVAGGVLLTRVNGFFGVAGFTLAAYVVSLAVFAGAGALRHRHAG